MISIRIKPLPNPSVISILGGLGLAWFSSSWGLGKHEGGGGGGGGGKGMAVSTTQRLLMLTANVSVTSTSVHRLTPLLMHWIFPEIIM